MRNATVIFAILYPFVPLAWTIAAFWVSGYEATITAVVRDYAARYPMAGIAVAVVFTSLCWHWFGHCD
jgi:hypothetical protein